MNVDLQAELEAAEAALLQLSIATKDAYRRFRDLDAAQTKRAWLLRLLLSVDSTRPKIVRRLMITGLTARQEALLPVIRDEWLACGLSAEPADRPAAERGIRPLAGRYPDTWPRREPAGTMCP